MLFATLLLAHLLQRACVTARHDMATSLHIVPFPQRQSQAPGIAKFQVKMQGLVSLQLLARKQPAFFVASKQKFRTEIQKKTKPMQEREKLFNCWCNCVCELAENLDCPLLWTAVQHCCFSCFLSVCVHARLLNFGFWVFAMAICSVSTPWSVQKLN